MSKNEAQKGGIRVRDLIDKGKTAGITPIPPNPFENDDRDQATDSQEMKVPAEQDAERRLSTVESDISMSEIPFIPVDFVTGLFSNTIRYENSKKTVLIDQGFKNMLDTLSQISKTDVSQILNNILNHFLGMESRYSIVPELHQYIQKQQQSISLNFKPKNKR